MTPHAQRRRAAMLTLGCLLAAAMPSAAQQQKPPQNPPVFRSGVDLVRVATLLESGAVTGTVSTTFTRK